MPLWLLHGLFFFVDSQPSFVLGLTRDAIRLGLGFRLVIGLGLGLGFGWTVRFDMCMGYVTDYRCQTL
jgi:hypothetical protein